MKKTLQTINSILGLLFIVPIWYYLIYVLLQAAHVDRLVWFLYYIYLPVGLLSRVIDAIIEKS